MINPYDPVGSLKPLLRVLEAPVIEGLLGRVDLRAHGGQLLYWACCEGLPEIVKLFLSKGVSATKPPDKISGETGYKKTPFILHAVKSGDIETVEAIVEHGGHISECGVIGRSLGPKNIITSNSFGSAAWFGLDKMLESLI